MKAIVAVDSNWGIGCNGCLLQRIPEDMKFFKEMTLGKVVIMGRETFESMPGKEPLKDRINIVLSRSECLKNEKITVCCSMDELFQKLEGYAPDDIFVIGGESVYTMLLPYCTEVYVTKINNVYTADRFFTDLDQDEAWELVSAGDLQTYKDISYRFVKYVNCRGPQAAVPGLK